MRRSARFTGAAVAMAAALLLSGCGSSDDGSKDEGKPSQNESQGTDGEGNDDPTNAEPGSLTGIWAAKTDGKDLILTVVGDGASLVHDENICSGRVTDDDKPSLTLKCPNGGNEERTNGSVESVDAKSLKVEWNGGATDTFSRQADAPSEMPTGLDGLEDLIPKG
ncbi:hypothetical protein JGS22_012110 [Streptomyces sp. P38-E01]|uniref:Lipoprotein n=1 Tax=Streptomyces tardus TaxID=2780544 RepID=A0A949N4W2_9ACTN|nr:hypothetical protein [Streptomyces tardus]MBU7598339.1 hypothetical protein [Streptomyces tardus]